MREAVARLSAVDPLRGTLDNVQVESEHASIGSYGSEVDEATDVLAQAAAASDHPDQAHPFVAYVRQFAENPVDPESESTGVLYGALSDIVAGTAGVDLGTLPPEDLAVFFGVDPQAARAGLALMGELLGGRLPDEALRETLTSAESSDLVTAAQMAPAMVPFRPDRKVGQRLRHIALAHCAKSLLFYHPLLKSLSLGPRLRQAAVGSENTLKAERNDGDL